MNKVVIDRDAKSKLGNLTHELEFCDENGQTLGYFIPATGRERELYDWAKREFTDEEVQRARAEPGGLTVDEVLKGLRDR